MQITELSTRGLSDETVTEVQQWVKEQSDRLSRFCPDLVSCRVAVERKQKRNPQNGNPYRVRVEVNLPGAPELVASHGLGDTDAGDPLYTIIRRTFQAVERQIKDTRAMMRRDVKHHEMDLGFVVRLFDERGYGFLRNADTGHQVFFHRNSVLHRDFDRLAVGTQVRYVEELGDDGPQASSVQVVDKPGEHEHDEDVWQEAPDLLTPR